LTWGPPDYTKLQLAAVGGRPPDVAISHATRLGSLAPAGLVMELTPDLLDKHGITPDKFEPAVWERGQFKGKQYAIPLDTHPFVLYYNLELAQKADLLGEDQRLRQLSGEQEVLDAFSALKKASGQWGVVTEIRGVSLWRLFLTLYGQQGGGPLFDAGGKELTIDDDNAFVIPVSGGRSKERLDAALEFVAAMLDLSYTWAQGGHVPAWKPVLDSEKYRKLSPQSHHASAAESTIVDPLVWFSGSGSDLENEAWGAFLGVVGGGSKPQAGLAQFRAAMQEFLRQAEPGLTVAVRQESLPSTLVGPRERGAAPKGAKTWRWGWMLTTPFFLVYFLFLLWPMLSAAWKSLFSDSLGRGETTWRGLGNYEELLHDADFWAAMWHTAWFTILTTVPLVILPLALALLVNRVAQGQWLFRLAFFAPFVLPVSVIVLVWQWLYQPGFGLINGYLTKLGIAEVNWLGAEGTAMIAVAIATVWWTLGFNFVLFIAGLQEIPRDLYEAAALDGAGPWAQTRRITLPLLMPTTVLVLVLQIIASLKVFDQIYLLLQGGPNFSTRPAVQYIYEAGFTQYRVGYASALSVVFFVLIIALSAALFAGLRRLQRGGTSW
jgi:multiple sugar transport system permease protein